MKVSALEAAIVNAFIIRYGPHKYDWIDVINEVERLRKEKLDSEEQDE